MFVQAFVLLVTGQHNNLLKKPWYGFLAIILFLLNVKEAISLRDLIEFFRSHEFFLIYHDRSNYTSFRLKIIIHNN